VAVRWHDICGPMGTWEGAMRYVKSEILSLRNHAEYREIWVQDRINEDPKILGLGDVFVRDKEKRQPHAGRLDFLLESKEEEPQRYEVEIQLGATDESHNIRTIEYWDIERKRYPQYEHTAVIVAEDITSRFFNVIGLFNGFIPIMALQMNAVKVEDVITLNFAKILGAVSLGLEEEDTIAEAADRTYWEKRAPSSLLLADKFFDKFIRPCDQTLSPNYTKCYIGTVRQTGSPFIVVPLIPMKKTLNVGIRLPQSTEVDEKIAGAGLDKISYNTLQERGLIKFPTIRCTKNIDSD
jgi:hypothetical protein